MPPRATSAPRLEYTAKQQTEFADLSVPIGERIKLEVRSPRLRATAIYLGYLPERSILLALPQRGTNLPSAAEGSVVTARMIVADRACAFSSRIQKLQLQPFPTLFIEYPQAVEAVVVRYAPRVPVKLLVSLDEIEQGSLGGRWPRQALCTDISLGGACIEADDLLGEAGDELLLTLRLPVGDVDQLLQLRCRIRNIEDLDDAISGHFRVVHGVEFQSADDATRVALTGFVYQQQLRQQGMI